jgi:hypothetical protein
MATMASPQTGETSANEYKYEFDDAQRREYGKMEKNREHVRRCLVCNVNLCFICENEFHGVQMCETAKLLGK